MKKLSLLLIALCLLLALIASNQFLILIAYFFALCWLVLYLIVKIENN